MAGAALQQQEPALREERFTFTATGSEYFRIWIVNILLTIVTLGIYSAWAKVRRNQYFYANTQLAGGGFDYHGKPAAILKGRIVAGVLFGAYNLAFRTSPALGACMMAVMMAVMPWLIWKSLQFALYNSSYRGLRFGFDGSAKGAYFHYLVLPLLGVVTLGFAYPFVHQRIKRWQHTESRYGGTHFGFDAPVGGFYKVYLAYFGAILVGIALLFGTMVATFAVLGGGDQKNAALGGFVAVAVFYPFMLCATWLVFAVLQNLIWNHTQLGEHRFRSAMTVKGLAWIYVSNTVAILCTLGLFVPFAKVRALKYRLDSTTLLVAGSLDDLMAGPRGDLGAIGDGAADLAGFDLGL